MTATVETQDPVVVRADGAELLDFPGGSQMRLLLDGTAGYGQISLLRSKLRSGIEGATPHHHGSTAEVFYVLSGTLQLLADDQVLLLEEGDLVAVPPGITHAFGAAPGADAEFLAITAPGIDRFDVFRMICQVANGDDAVRARLRDQSRFDSHSDPSPEWNRVRNGETTSS